MSEATPSHAAATEYPPVPDLHWSDELQTGDARMDETHTEFVDQLAELRALSPAEQLEPYRALIRHTEAHFGQEDRWMQTTGFTHDNCHSGQHQQVLAIMREVTRLAKEHDDFGPLQRVLPELGKWFANHAQTMDAMLASHLEQVGFDPATGFVGHPLNTSQPITGCGGDHACATDKGQQQPATAETAPASEPSAA